MRDIEARRDYMMTLVHDYVKVMLNNVEVTYSEEMEDLNKNLEVRCVYFSVNTSDDISLYSKSINIY